MSYLRSQAIVLSRTNYQEADRIIDFLTPERGIVGTIARGVRKEKSKLAGAIELFSIVDLTTVKGKGELEIITSARLEKYYGHIVENYERLQFGYEILKQIRREAAPISDSAFFTLLHQALIALNNTSIDLRVTKVWYYLQLSILLGTGFNLSTDDNGDALAEDQQYEFLASQGVLRLKTNGEITSQHIKLLRLLSAQSPQVAMRVTMVDTLIEDCLLLARHHLAIK